nr:hypothetical protein [Sulfodiicoccus acidiphilus]
MRKVADEIYSEGEIEAPTSSSSYRVDAMSIVPCSIRTLAEVTSGITLTYSVEPLPAF